MRKLLRYLIRVKLSDRLPRIPYQWATDYDPSEVDRTAERLMELTAIRAPGAIKRLERRYRRSADELVASLPLPRWQRRNTLKGLIGRTLRLMNYDPFKRYAPRRRDRRQFVPEPRSRR